MNKIGLLIALVLIGADEERERGKGERGKGTSNLKALVSNMDTAKFSLRDAARTHYVSQKSSFFVLHN